MAERLSSLRALEPERALFHPLWIGSLVLLVANDHWLKGAGLFHTLVTGKLSDVAGMLVAPALLAVLLRAKSPRAIAWCHAATGAGLAAVKLSPSAAQALVEVMSWLGIHWRIWCDATDLIALPALWLSWRVLVPAMQHPIALVSRARQLGQLVAAGVGLVACLGTSKVQEPPPAPPPQPVQMAAPQQTALTLSALDGARWTSEGEGYHLSYRFEGARYTTTGNPPWEESGRLELVESRGQQMRVRFVDRVYDGNEDEPVERTIEVAPDGQSFQMEGRVFKKQAHVAVVAGE